MGTAVHVNTYTHAATFVAGNLLWNLKKLITACGLDPEKMVKQWDTLESGIATWLGSRDLETLILEVFDPSDRFDDRRGRFDFIVDYSYCGDGDGDFWLDPDAVRYTIRKRGSLPSSCDYRIVAITRPGAVIAPGWGAAQLRSTEGMTQHSIGTTMGAGPLGASLTYYRRS